MEEIKTIPNEPRIREITYTPKFSAVCSVGKAPFNGTLFINYQPGDRLLEFESFEDWIKQHSNDSTTIEGYCRLVFDTLSQVLGDVPLTVHVDAETIKHAPVTAKVWRD